VSAPTYGVATDYSKPPAQAVLALPPERYTGTYRQDFYGEAIVTVKDGALVLELGPKRLAFPLQHWDRDTFLYTPPGENSTGPSGVTFVVDPTGRASSIVIENFDQRLEDGIVITTGEGIFTRVSSTAP